MFSPSPHSMDRQTTGEARAGLGSPLSANPARLKGRERDRRRTKRRGRGGRESRRKRRPALPATQPATGERALPCSAVLLGEATKNRLGGAEGQGWGGEHEMRRVRIFCDGGLHSVLGNLKS